MVAQPPNDLVFDGGRTAVRCSLAAQRSYDSRSSSVCCLRALGLVRTMPRVTVTQLLYEAMLAMDWVSRHEFMKNLWRLASVAIC